MKTKLIPALIMLLGGATACIFGMKNHYQTTEFLTMLFIVLLVFYMLGSIIKMLLDRIVFQENRVVEEIKEELEDAIDNIESENKDDE